MSACNALNTLCDYGGAGSSDEDDSVSSNNDESATPNSDQDKFEEAADTEGTIKTVEVSAVKEDTELNQSTGETSIGEKGISIEMILLVNLATPLHVSENPTPFNRACTVHMHVCLPISSVFECEVCLR